MLQQLETSEIAFKLKQSKQYWELKRKLIQGLKQQQTPICTNDIQQYAQSNEIEAQLKKLISNYIKKSRKREPIKEDSMEVMNVAKLKWTELLFKNLDNVYQMSKCQEEDESNKDSKLFIYDEKHLLSFIINMKSMQTNIILQNNRLISLQLPLKPISQTLDRFRYLLYQEELSDEKISKLKKQIENEQLESELEGIASQFVPNGDRTLLYLKYFELDNKDSQLEQHHSKLVKESKVSNFYDDLLEINSNEISEDSFYFIFSDQIQQCLKCFIRDKSVKETITIQLHVQIPTRQSEFTLPQCGLLPFKNLAKYVAPFCYLSTKPHITYALFKEFFCRYFCYLHSISSQSNGVIVLLAQIEEAVSNQSPKLFHHLKTIGADTVKVIAKQVISSFIGYLEPQELLLLFDQFIGWNGLDILIILSIGVLNKYKSKLLLSKSMSDVQQIMRDGHEDKFHELVQWAYQ